MYGINGWSHRHHNPFFVYRSIYPSIRDVRKESTNSTQHNNKKNTVYAKHIIMCDKCVHCWCRRDVWNKSWEYVFRPRRSPKKTILLGEMEKCINILSILLCIIIEMMMINIICGLCGINNNIAFCSPFTFTIPTKYDHRHHLSDWIRVIWWCGAVVMRCSFSGWYDKNRQVNSRRTRRKRKLS